MSTNQIAINPNECLFGWELEKRVSLVETHIDYIKKQLEQNNRTLYEIQRSIGIIERQLTKQNSVLPRLEESLKENSQRIDTNNRTSIEASLKQKILWGALAMIFGALIGTLIRILLSGGVS